MTTGLDIADKRRRLDMTQDHLAGAACVSRSTVQRAERGLPISAESLRAIRAVLGLDADRPATSPCLGTGSDAPVAAEPAQAAVAARTGWRLDLALASVVLAFAVVTTWDFFGIHEGLREACRLALPDLDKGQLWFLSGMVEAAIPATAACLAGRMLWKGLFHRDADTLVVGLGPLLWSRAWRVGAIEVRRIPWPVARWARGGRAVRTWPGALAMAALMLPMAFVAQIHPVKDWSYATRFGDFGVRPIVPAWYVEPGSPLERAGFRLGDLVTAMDGIPVSEGSQTMPRIWSAYGRTMAVTVSRLKPVVGRSLDRETVTLQVPVGDGPSPACSGEFRCAWIGSRPGFEAPRWRERSTGERWLKFKLEVGNMARAIADTDTRKRVDLMSSQDSWQTFTLWYAFHYAFLLGTCLLAIAGFALRFGADACPRLRRGAGRLAGAASRMTASTAGGPRPTWRLDQARLAA